jgi:hypothetical protein
MVVSRQTRKKKNTTVSPATVLAFVSKNPEFLPSIPNHGGFTIEEDIERVRITLLHNGGKRLKTYTKLVETYNIPTISETVLKGLMKDSRRAGIRERPSPPFSANALCGAKMKGNSSKTFESVKNASGVCQWILA